MLIKTVTLSGKAVTYSPKEALPFAVENALKQLNTKDEVFWCMHDSVTTTSIHTTELPGGGWEAQASGSVKIGKTHAATDRFFEPKTTNFTIHYRLGKNDLGLPEAEVVSFKKD